MTATFTLTMEMAEDEEGKWSSVPTFVLEGDTVTNSMIAFYLREVADCIESDEGISRKPSKLN